MDFSLITEKEYEVNAFDPAAMELDGYALIEASAGTGKTYGITSLYLRLIMEQGLLPGQILVVTFTRAATEELVMKIRQRLEAALAYLKRGQEPENDKFIPDLEARLFKQGIDKEVMVQRIHEALLRLDEAAVFTIHGFCQRMLNEFAFEAGAPLKKDLIPSEAELQREGCRQFCRTVLYHLDEKRLRAVEKVLGIDKASVSLSGVLYHRMKSLLSMPRPKILPELTLKQGLEILDKRAKALAQLKALYHEHGAAYKKFLQEELDRCIEEFVEPISEFPWISRVMPKDFVLKRMNKECTELLEKRFEKLLEYDPEDTYEDDGLYISSLLFEQFCSGRFLFKGWNVVTRSRAGDLKHVSKKAKETIGNELSSLWEERYSHKHTLPDDVAKSPFYQEIIHFLKEFETADQEFLSALLSDSRDFVLEEVKKQKALLAVISYDDMIKELHQALVEEPGAEILAQRIKNRFSAALIDEFQDTDRLQWEIFSAIYPDPERDRLYLIGDPKQAIYGFRGADIFTYLKAKEAVPAGRHFSLNTNWRSNRELIAATNTVFGADPEVFVLDGIEYTQVNPKPDGHEWVELTGEETCPAISVELWEDSSHEEECARFTAWEIARLLALGQSGKAFIRSDNGRSEPIEAGHIAVLVYNFYEAGQVRDELSRLDIPAVYYGRSSIFRSSEATELLYVLNAVAAPADQRAVATALGTVMLGYQAEDIFLAQKTPGSWDRIVDHFVQLKRIWQDRGVLPMLMALFHRFHLPKRLLGIKGGERSLTNLRQLAELLSDAEKELPGAEQLILWLKQNIQGETGQEDEYQLRLETDENVVKIMTYHRSKGLEFPVVFLPFLDQIERKRREGPEIYYSHEHDCYIYHCLDKKQKQAVDDDETDGPFTSPYQEQSDAEVMRLIYVAITRARCRLYLPVSDGKISRLIAVDDEQELDCLEDEPDLEPEEIKEDPMESLRKWDERIKQILTGSEDSGVAELAQRDDEARDEKKQDEEDAELEGLDHEEHRKKILGRLDGVPGVACLLTDELQKRYGQIDLKKGFFSHTKGPITPPSSITRRPLAPWTWRQLSFTSITAFDDSGRDDAISAMLRASSALEHRGLKLVEGPDNMFGFPKGARAGNCIHALFENIDFGADQMAIKEEALRCLSGHEIDERWADILTEMAVRVLNTELSPGVRLGRIHPSWISKEMGFYMPVTKASMQRFQRLFPEMEQGMMKGFIDLFFRHEESFYIGDYKSNWLGDDPSDYSQKGMEQAMDEHDYWLQAAIYLNAMEQYLLSNCPEGGAHKVAGVFYLFVRGVGADSNDPGCGICFIKPEELRKRFPDLFSSFSSMSGGTGRRDAA